MRTLFMVGRELEYPRNDVILRALQRFSQVEVVGVDVRPSSLLLNSVRITLRALPKLLYTSYDLVFVGFYGHLLMLPVRLLTRRPVLFDAFVSTYDTLVLDREILPGGSILGRLASWLDRRACLNAKRVLLDTQLHVTYFVESFGLSAGKFSALPVGCNEDIFSPRPHPAFADEQTRVLYYSSYLPLHGVETVVRTAALLKSEPILFRLIGDGRCYKQVRLLADDLQLANVEFVPPVPLRQLPGELARADICLGGHFGLSEKAGRVVPGKVYQILAMGAPLIAADVPVNLDLLQHGESAYLVPPGDPQALAAGILELHNDRPLRRHLAVGARTCYLERCSEAIITEQLQQIVNGMVH